LCTNLEVSLALRRSVCASGRPSGVCSVAWIERLGRGFSSGRRATGDSWRQGALIAGGGRQSGVSSLRLTKKQRSRGRGRGGGGGRGRQGKPFLESVFEARRFWSRFGGTLALRAQRASGLSAVCCARECVCQKAARREQAVEVSAHKAEGRTQKAEKAQKKPQSTTTRRKARAHALASIHLSVFSFGPLALCVFFRFSVRHS